MSPQIGLIQSLILMQIVSSKVYFISIFGQETSKFQVFHNLVGAWTLRYKQKTKRKKISNDEKCASPSTLGNTPCSRISPFVTTSEP